ADCAGSESRRDAASGVEDQFEIDGARHGERREEVTALFRKLSIRRKQVLIIMLTTTVALLLACSAFVFYDVVDFRSELVERIGSITEVIAEHSTASLDF